MMVLLRYILGFFRKRKADETPVGPFHIPEEEVAGSITFSYTQEGDFNVIVSPQNMSLDCAAVTGTLLFLLNSGGLSEFFGQSYSNWANDDPERELFMTTAFAEWVRSERMAKAVDTDLAVEPCDVFNWKGSPNDN